MKKDLSYLVKFDGLCNALYHIEHSLDGIRVHLDNLDLITELPDYGWVVSVLNKQMDELKELRKTLDEE